MRHAKGSPVYKTWIIISVALLSTAREGNEFSFYKQICARVKITGLFFYVVRTLRWLHPLDRGIEAVEGGKIALRWDYDLEGQTLDEIEWVDMSTLETIPRKFAPPRKPSVNPEFPSFNVSNTEKATLYISPVELWFHYPHYKQKKQPTVCSWTKRTEASHWWYQALPFVKWPSRHALQVRHHAGVLARECRPAAEFRVARHNTAGPRE